MPIRKLGYLIESDIFDNFETSKPTAEVDKT